MAITLLGFAALAYGIVSFVRHGSFSIYFTLFGLAAIFTFAGFSVLPTARNNRTSIMQNDTQAQEKMQAYLADYMNFRCRPAMHIRLCCAACSVPSWMAVQ